MSDLDLVVRGRRVVTDTGIEPLSVGVRAGRIHVLAPLGSPVSATRVVDIGDDEVLLPGLVDTHVHVNEPGRTEWEGFASATRSAAAGGVTTIVDMPLNSIPPTVDVAALRTKQAAASGQSHVDVGFWAGAVPANLGSLRSLQDAGVCGFKCFLAPSGVEEFPCLDAAGLDAALAELAEFDGLLVVHAEDAATLDAAPACHGNSYRDFLRSRPHEAEDIAIARVVELAGHRRARAHVVHLSSADALPAVTAARAEGVRLSVETCPHYLTLEAEQIGAGQTQFKCCPPIRRSANRERLWDGLRDGTIDCIVSDHSPSTPALKLLDVGDFGRAWGGISSLQLGLPLVWTEARRRGHDLTDVVRWMATRPAEIATLPGKGRIAEGYAADMVVFAADETFAVDPAALHHRHPLTPYAGRGLTGVVRSTWLRGVEITGRDPAGQLLRRGGT